MTLHFEDDRLALYVFVSGFSNNAWLLVSKSSQCSLIIDTPGEPRELVAAAEKTDVQGILITHNHGDHLEGFRTVHDAFPAPVGIGSEDAQEVRRRGAEPEIDVSNGQTIAVDAISLTALHTPGHTPGSTCYFLETSARRVFSGDTLFPGGPGRTTSSAHFKRITQSIASQLLTLPEDTVVHPGHGADTTIGEAKREYEMFASRRHSQDLYGNVTWLGG